MDFLVLLVLQVNPRFAFVLIGPSLRLRSLMMLSWLLKQFSELVLHFQQKNYLMDQANSIPILSVHTVKPELISFPIPELLQLLAMHPQLPPINKLLEREPGCGQLTHAYECRNSVIQYLPFIRLSFPAYSTYPGVLQTEDPLYVSLNEVCDRAVLTQSFVLILAQGPDYQNLQPENLELLKEYTQDEEQKLSFQVFSGNRQTTKQEQLEAIDFITEHFQIRGTIDIKQASRSYWLCEYHQPFDTGCKPLYKETLKWVYFGVQIAFNRKNRRHYTSNYELPNRAYLGPTSTSAPLAFIMTNQAQVRPHQVVLDPFVGTGGLLVPAAHHGAVTFGSDIDARVIHGHAVGHINTHSTFPMPEPVKPYMFYSFLQYGLPVPELIRQDCLNSGFQRAFFDAIICDPPYGIRAVSRGTGKKERKQTHKEEQKEPAKHKPDYVIPTKKVDHLMIYEQLFNAADKMLKPGGMLVYLHPFDREHGPATLKDIPRHESFELVNYAEESLTMLKSRILISMRKCA